MQHDTQSIDIVKESEALKEIRDWLDVADLDDLAMLYTRFCMTNMTILVHDNCKAKDVFMLACGKDAFSGVCQDGDVLGYIDEDGKLQMFPERYEALPLDNGLVPIRDTRIEKVVAYAPIESLDTVLLALRQGQ